jgi:cysteine-S-conjugate beta-lyase
MGHHNILMISNTQLIHHPYLAPEGFAAVQPPTHKAATVIFDSVADMRSRRWQDKTGYTYGLHGTPSTFVLEQRLASLEGGAHCLLVPSGLAALACVNLALLKTGDEVLIPANAYGPNKDMARGLLAQWGISHKLYDPLSPADLQVKLSAKTKLVWLEAPGSVTMEFPPLIELVNLCRQHQVPCALDNTWGAGLAFSAFNLSANEQLGVDVSIQALTKYVSGGGDVLMGSVVSRDQSLHQCLQSAHMQLGLGVAGDDVTNLLRSMPSMALRYRAQDAAARQLAQWLAHQSPIAQVLHPALDKAPGHENWQAVCGAQNLAAGLFSVVFQPQYTSAQVDAFCDALTLFKLGYSWGSHLSLVVPYDLAAIRPTPSSHLKAGRLVRFSIGLEEVQDLQADLAQALTQMG